MYRKTRDEGFGAEVKRRIMLGTYVLSSGYYDAYYEKAQRVRTLLGADFDRAFERCDVIATPTAPTLAFRSARRPTTRWRCTSSDIYTVTVNLAGLPADQRPLRPLERRPRRSASSSSATTSTKPGCSTPPTLTKENAASGGSDPRRIPLLPGDPRARRSSDPAASPR